MNSQILSTAARITAPLMLAFSLFILLRGHNEPGGGFIGGLIAATAFAVFAKSDGTLAARRALRIDPITLSLLGLGAAALSGVWGWAAEGAFLAGAWPLLETGPDGGKKGLPIGSILMFDVGVYLVVVGAVAALFLALEEDAARGEGEPAAPTRPGPDPATARVEPQRRAPAPEGAAARRDGEAEHGGWS